MSALIQKVKNGKDKILLREAKIFNQTIAPLKATHEKIKTHIQAGNTPVASHL
jgi:hypothetical protein